MSPLALLIIDDDPIFRELVRLCLEGIDIDVLEAADCVHGVELLRKNRDRVALVLLDYWMPHMVPVQCSAKIRELVCPSTRVVLVTASVDAKLRADEIGLAEWLAKPIDIKVLRRIVQDSLTAKDEPARA